MDSTTNTLRAVVLPRFVRRWDITTSDMGHTMTTTVECDRIAVALHAEKMTRHRCCVLVSITPNEKAHGTAGGGNQPQTH